MLDALVSARTAGPLWRTIQLTVLVSAGATMLGVGLAWLTVRTDLPGRQVWRVTAVLPLVIPSFVGAAAWKLTFERRGILEEWFGITSFPEMRGLRGRDRRAVLFAYPYVYLPVAARLASLPPSLEENARILGRSPATPSAASCSRSARPRSPSAPCSSRCTRSATSGPCR